MLVGDMGGVDLGERRCVGVAELEKLVRMYCMNKNLFSIKKKKKKNKNGCLKFLF